MQPIIEIKNIGKKYNINHQRGGYIALRDVLANIAKNPFKFLKNKAKEVTGIATKEEFWALKNVSLNINKGDIVGVIGSNGAGKSTLLKILTGITPPTEGEIIMRGRVASLLEVGTGFHPELTGRENIFLNGAIIGMTKKEIVRKFDEIVTFAGIEKFLDTPVKYYSSGMYVRLAFSVAAHMEPDILLVDEVLAVGDAEFQKKCLGKMEEVTKTSGRTILFVSHNLSAIQELCEYSILLEKGQVKMFGKTNKVIDSYVDGNTSNEKKEWVGDAGDENVKLTRTYAKSLDKTGAFNTSSPIEVGLEGKILNPVRDLVMGFSLFSETGQKLAYVLYDDKEDSIAPTLEPGEFLKKFVIPANTLAHGYYRIEIDIGIHRTKRIVKNEGGLGFKIMNNSGLGRRFQLPEGNGLSSFFRPDWSI